MNWQLALTTFASIFLAELGDKTQVATFALAATEKSTISVLIGSIAALTAAAIMAVVLGSYVGEFVPAHWIRRAAGAVFLVMGILYLSKG